MVDEKDVIIRLLKKCSLTISELERASGISRSFIRSCLSELKGANKVSYRLIGKAKLYSWDGTRSKS